MWVSQTCTQGTFLFTKHFVGSMSFFLNSFVKWELLLPPPCSGWGGPGFERFCPSSRANTSRGWHWGCESRHLVPNPSVLGWVASPRTSLIFLRSSLLGCAFPQLCWWVERWWGEVVSVYSRTEQQASWTWQGTWWVGLCSEQVLAEPSGGQWNAMSWLSCGSSHKVACRSGQNTGGEEQRSLPRD